MCAVEPCLWLENFLPPMGLDPGIPRPALNPLSYWGSATSETLQQPTIRVATYHPAQSKQEGHEALKRSPEYTGQSQTFNFEIWMTFGQVQRMKLTFDTHSTSLTHLAECFKRL